MLDFVHYAQGVQYLLYGVGFAVVANRTIGYSRFIYQNGRSILRCYQELPDNVLDLETEVIRLQERLEDQKNEIDDRFEELSLVIGRLDKFSSDNILLLILFSYLNMFLKTTFIFHLYYYSKRFIGCH